MIAAAALLAAPAQAATSGANGTHDPSRMIESEGRFYVFSTGASSKSSPDGLVWTAGPRFLNAVPADLGLPDDQGIWAPDVIFLNNQYYLYYSVAASSTKACAIGLLTSPTLNPSSPSYKWTDRGLVVASSNSDTHCTIDPAPILDAANNLWVVWGGGYTNATTANAIWVTRLDNTTGLPSSADPATPGHPIELGHKEGSYLHYHGGNYYLFWQTGSCCNGAASTYEMHVARSPTITGPYIGDRIFYASNGSIHGPGHIGIYSACGVERFTYHYYPDTGGSVLGENDLAWGTDGWPVAGPQSIRPLAPCGQTGTSGTGGATGSGGSGAGGAGAGGRRAGMGGSDGAGPGGGGGNVPGLGGAIAGAGGSAAGGAPGSAGAGTGGGAAGQSGDPALGGTDSGCACGLTRGDARPGIAAVAFLSLALILAASRRVSRRGHRRGRRGWR